MRKAVIIGVGAHKCGRFLDESLKELGRVALSDAIEDAMISPKDIQAAYVSNSLAGLTTGQESVRGQTVLRDYGIGGIPIINVEDACASATAALRGAYMEVASGCYDLTLALGVEKMYMGNTAKELKALITCYDMELVQPKIGMQFTSLYANELRRYMHDYGATREQFAKVVVKNSHNGSLNPIAQYGTPKTVEEVINSRMISDPLTLYMCCPMSDGAAAAIVCSEDMARKFTDKPLISIEACELVSGAFRDPRKIPSAFRDAPQRASISAYKRAGITPKDVDVVEVHDAMAPDELMIYEDLGFCEEGKGTRMIDEGMTEITGDIPVNPSGGLTARGHPIGATGLLQAAEIVWQLRGEARKRQVADPVIGLTENAGGFVDDGPAACSITILKRIT